MVTDIPKGSLIGIDTMVFIYHLEDHPDFSGITEKLFDSIEKGKYGAVTSYVTLLEILVKPKREGEMGVASEYREILLTFPNLKFLPLDLAITDLASTLRASYSIKTPNAIQIAAAVTAGAEFYVTNDEKMKRVEELDVLMLGDLGK